MLYGFPNRSGCGNIVTKEDWGLSGPLLVEKSKPANVLQEAHAFSEVNLASLACITKTQERTDIVRYIMLNVHASHVIATDYHLQYQHKS